MPGLIFVVAIYTFPYVYIMIANTLAPDRLRPGGGGRASWAPTASAVALTITLPMVLPAILSGFILAVLQALALFGSPAILGAAGGLSHDHDADLVAVPVPAQDRDGGGVLRCRCCWPPPCCCSCRSSILGRRGYAAIGGKGGQRRRHPARAVALPGARRLPRRAWRAPSSCPTAFSPRPRSRARGPSRSRGTTSRSPTGRSRSLERPRRTPS